MENISKIKKIKNLIKSKLELILDILTIAIGIAFIFAFLILIMLMFYKWDVSKTEKILEFLKFTDWPVFAFVFVFLFKKNIAKFIDELEHLKIFGNEATRETPPNSQREDLNVDKMSEKIENTTNDSQSNDCKNELKKTSLYLEYERIYNIIFGSQIELLDILKINSTGLNMNFLGIYFHSIQKKFEGSLDQWTLFQYLRFMETTGLIQFNNTNNSYSITEKGRGFLNYIESLKYPKGKGL